MLKKGIVFVDKPAGITSFQLVEKVKEYLRAEKAGHSGTLDMGVTGVMLVALGEATKAMPVLVGLDKEYEGVMHTHANTDEKDIREACASFVGKIIQTPPRKSAVKREPRERTIHSLEIMKIVGRDVFFRVKCQSGTYIRKLCSDIGEKIGGAHMAKLRRTRLGLFPITECVKLEDLSPGSIKSLESVLQRVGVRGITIRTQFMERIMNGMPLEKEWVKSEDKGIKSGEIIALYSENNIIALAIYKEKSYAKVDRIFITN